MSFPHEASTHPPDEIEKAVILARGLGKRMRAEASSATLEKAQAHVASTGMKAMIPMGRPFLDYVLGALAEAGCRRICLVIGPEHEAIREYYRNLSPTRIGIEFAVQERPLGTANALLAAQAFAGNHSFLVLNSDTYYPVPIFRALRELGEPGLPAFERTALLREGNMPPERVRNYALLEINDDGYLTKIVEKPVEVPPLNSPREVFISMNCWRFDSAIFRACREVPPSPRGEWELPVAVGYGLENLGLRLRALKVRAGVLDLSYRTDIATVAERLAGIQVRL